MWEERQNRVTVNGESSKSSHCSHAGTKALRQKNFRKKRLILWGNHDRPKYLLWFVKPTQESRAYYKTKKKNEQTNKQTNKTPVLVLYSGSNLTTVGGKKWRIFPCLKSGVVIKTVWTLSLCHQTVCEGQWRMRVLSWVWCRRAVVEKTVLMRLCAACRRRGKLKTSSPLGASGRTRKPQMARVDYPNSNGWFHIAQLLFIYIYIFFISGVRESRESTAWKEKRPMNRCASHIQESCGNVVRRADNTIPTSNCVNIPAHFHVPVAAEVTRVLVLFFTRQLCRRCCLLCYPHGRILVKMCFACEDLSPTYPWSYFHSGGFNPPPSPLPFLVGLSLR